ncbi:MAG: EamA family transporter [Methylobacterium frigidaeris]
MSSLLISWPFWAVLSAVFAALTAILAKAGVEGVASDVATFLRTLVVVAVTGALLAASGQWRLLTAVPGRSTLFLVLSGLATGASWLCYFRALALGDAARVAPLDKLSVVFVALFGVLLLGERLSVINWLGIALIAAGAVLAAIKG